MNNRDPQPARLVACPTCHGDSLFARSNPYRPFCSARCKNMDLGAWASEGFRVPAETMPGDQEKPDTGLQ